MQKIRVLIVDDHPLARKGIATLLSDEPDFEIVGEAGDGHAALEQVRSLLPDLVLMDIMMPGLNGFSATEAIKHEFPETRIVIVTVSGEAQDLFEAIKHGAQGYLLKNLAPDDWGAYLRGVARGEAPISRRTAERILSEFDLSPVQDSDTQLSRRETEVLRLVAKGHSNREIAGALGIAENTVKNHLKNILAKLQLKNRVQLATYAVRSGIDRGGRP